MIVKVAVDLALNREFDYLVPDSMRDAVQPGVRVAVPFGAREVAGWVTSVVNASERTDLKFVARVTGERPYLSAPLLALARWIADYYCAPLENALRTMLPAPVRSKGEAFREERVIEALTGAWPQAAEFEALRRKAPKQAAALEKLRGAGLQSARELIDSGVSDAVLRALAARGWVRIGVQNVRRDPLIGQTLLRTEPLVLNPQQALALGEIHAAIDEDAARVMLLFGVTGSGKTEVYLQAIARAVAAGRDAIVLVPEIALTPQTIERFRGRFGDMVAVLHSHLSDGERHDEWHRLFNGQAHIAIGARSALFAPVQRLGLIVVDEEHEPSYKQNESPRYHARDVAVMRGHFERCPVVLGSATPALESWWNAQKGKYRLLRMPQRVDDKRMPTMRVVDMRREAEQTGRMSIFSRDLLEAMRRRLVQTEQTILFLNRRGYATQMLCPECGYVAQCDQCSVALVYHREAGELRCHICGAMRHAPDRCPQCQAPAVKFTGIGTQRIEAAVRRLLPKANVARMDADTTRGRDAHRRILNEFRSGAVDILVGTQMIAKGLDFPNVTLIGVMNADSALHLPDFRAGERTFQLLTQVAGRAGRGALPGEVIVQTCNPFHPAVQAARRMDYEGFCDQEAAMREELGYPPHGRAVCIGFRGLVEARVRSAAEAFAAALQPGLAASVQVAPPGPAPLARAKGLYRYQMLLRAPLAKTMTRPLNAVLNSFRWPGGVAVAVDVDAVDLM
ncbi:MAG: primosomal protein N' [bacterium]